MPTSQAILFLSEIIEGSCIPDEKLNYFRARLKNRLHAMVLAQFMNLEKDRQFTRADLARRLGKKPEQITRWLGAPGNWTLDTVSDLLLGMGNEPTLAISNLAHGAIQPAKEQWKMASINLNATGNETESLASMVRPGQQQVVPPVSNVIELASFRAQNNGVNERMRNYG